MLGSELLSYLSGDILHDANEPRLWSDPVLLMYLNEAERAFARKTYALYDQDNFSITTSVPDPVTHIGTFSYPLDPLILFVEGAMIDNVLNGIDLGDYTQRFIPTNLKTSLGNPRIFTTDQATKTIRFYPVPDNLGVNADGSYTIALRVARLPLQDFDATTEPEIPSQYHLDLCEFAAWRALRTQDVDGQNIKAAESFLIEWNKRLLEAKREIYRYRSGADATTVNNFTGLRRKSL